MSNPLDPAAVLSLAERRAREAPVDLSGITRPEVLAADDALEESIAALKAILDLLPPGAAGVPEAAFPTAEGREEYARDPRRFQRIALTMLRDQLKRVGERLGRRAGELADPAFHARNQALMDTLFKGLNTPEDPDHRARREAHERAQEESLAAYHASVRQRAAQGPPAQTPFARVLAAPDSEAARRALLAAWTAAGDPRAALLGDMLTLRAHHRDGTLGSPEAQALSRRVNLAVARASRPLPPELAGLVSGVTYLRGLVGGVTLPGARLPAVAARLFAVAPIQHLTLTEPMGDLASLFATPELQRVVSLNVHGLGAAFGDTGAMDLAESPRVSGLRWLALTACAIGEAGAGALAASPHLAGLRYLSLAGNPADPTPYASVYDGVPHTGRPPLAVALERAHGPRPWLAEPTDAASWPPDRDTLAESP